jgi:hypothetical protein
LLVRVRGQDAVFPCLDFRDELHGLLIFLHRQLFELLEFIPFTAASKRLLDRRLALLGASRRFKDNYGKSFRNQRTLFAETNMTGSDRACLIFLLPNVFGITADSVLPDIRLHFPLMTAISRAQLMLIASRGLRLYTQSELRDIFDQGYLEMFSALESVRRISHEIRVARHRLHPSKFKMPTNFVPRSKYADETETSDTGDEFNIGVGPYSHGSKCLVHQHWVLQLITLGGFNVNGAQSSEGDHKLSAKEAASRVRHLLPNETQKSMLRYLFYRIVFTRVGEMFPLVATPARALHTPATGVFSPLLNPDSSPVQMETGSRFTTQVFQTQFIHKEVLVCRFELLDMLCDKFELPKTLQSYESLEQLDYSLGAKFVKRDGETFWATDTQYPYDTAYNRRNRRDAFIIEGYHEAVHRHPSGEHVVRRNALSGEATCFMTVSNISRLNLPCLGPDAPRPLTRDQRVLRESVVSDSLSFVLLRWFEPHELCTSRDVDNRPICPAPLNINHCLWKYAQSDTVRRSIMDRGNPTTSVRQQLAMFGSTPEQQQSNIIQQQNAYYGLVYPQHVKDTINICPCFLHGETRFDETLWLQTVTVI